MDEVSLLIDLLSGGNRWSTAAQALVSEGKIASSHAVTPEFIDVRSITANKAVRVDLGKYPATIVVFEDGQNLEYPTIHYDIRNETYNFTLHIRVLHDERSGFDSSYGKDRLRAIYLILRRVLDSKRKGYSDSNNKNKFNQLFVGSRSESNDRAKRLFGYKVSVEAKKFAVSIP